MFKRVRELYFRWKWLNTDLVAPFEEYYTAAGELERIAINPKFAGPEGISLTRDLDGLTIRIHDPLWVFQLNRTSHEEVENS